jgi:hypothetical protein
MARFRSPPSFPDAIRDGGPHIHFEVYRDLTTATSGGDELATSQLAFPKAACDAVYATAGYESSQAVLRGLSLARDGVFRDGADRQTAIMTGDLSAGITATLTVAV